MAQTGSVSERTSGAARYKWPQSDAQICIDALADFTARTAKTRSGITCENHDAPTIVVNAAGGVCGQVGQPIDQVSAEELAAIFNTNVNSAWHLAQATLPAMQGIGHGRFITISSGAVHLHPTSGRR